MAGAFPRKVERVSVEQIENYVKRFGPVSTKQIRQFFGLPKNTGLFDKVKKVSTLVEVKSTTTTHRCKVWRYQERENATTPVMPQR